MEQELRDEARVCPARLKLSSPLCITNLPPAPVSLYPTRAADPPRDPEPGRQQTRGPGSPDQTRAPHPHIAGGEEVAVLGPAAPAQHSCTPNQ